MSSVCLEIDCEVDPITKKNLVKENPSESICLTAGCVLNITKAKHPFRIFLGKLSFLSH